MGKMYIRNNIDNWTLHKTTNRKTCKLAFKQTAMRTVNAHLLLRKRTLNNTVLMQTSIKIMSISWHTFVTGLYVGLQARIGDFIYHDVNYLLIYILLMTTIK